MHDWIKVTLILCLFGTLREIRPSEPFVTEFLLGKWRNITQIQLNRDVYPVGTYSYLALLVLVFLITDFLRFKPIIIVSGLSGIAVYAVLLWTSSLGWLQVSQVLYGTYIATEVAYYTYIYAKVDPSKYPKVSSYTRIAALIGRCLSGFSSQLLIYFAVMDLRQLNYITFTAQILATFWAFWLPPVTYGIYFHQQSVTNNAVQPRSPIDKQSPSASDTTPLSNQVSEASRLIYRHVRSAYSRPRVVAWSALYAVALALFVQGQTYMQLLWSNIQGEDRNKTFYNGAVEAVLTLLGAAGAFLASMTSFAVLPAPVAAVQGVAMFLATFFNNIFASYAGYIVMGMLHHYTITLASAKIAAQLSDDSCFGLIFGINTLMGSGLQALLTLVLIQTMELPIQDQYYYLSGFFLLLACSWLLGWIINRLKQKNSINLNRS